ncbi:methyltransferase domain-containing protein [Lichenibacterium minor]|uniref:Methyltransferase domain-containing protein n=1 Tax=Lichenibacterium minor TaxID=2316528 RepID=A0A4Q2U9I1_9HYPH|nr:class I SAM-dependent methyltransferase [Lichenibacterium minor]RYC32578.1 methyltransferase domain-containing protein [Lichenibacterium minor]
MTDAKPSLDSRYFDDIYARTIDPWGFRTSPYERGKYEATLGILPRPRYRSALEVGCSIGVFTRMLAGRSDSVLALDTSALALGEARTANAGLPNVAFREATLPRDFPDGRYDLIVLSEVLYYLSRPDLAALAGRCLGALEPDGQVVLCHWLGETDYPLRGDEAADLFIAAAAPRCRSSAARREPEYRLDLLSAGG